MNASWPRLFRAESNAKGPRLETVEPSITSPTAMTRSAIGRARSLSASQRTSRFDDDCNAPRQCTAHVVHDVSAVDLCFSDDVEGDVARAISAHRPAVIGLSLRNVDNCAHPDTVSYLPHYRRVVESLTSGVRWAQLFLKFRPALKRVKADKSARAYTDLALSASSDEELNEMDLIQVFKGAIPRTHGAPAVARESALP